MTNGLSSEESYGHFYDTENPDDESVEVEYVVLYSERQYKVCKKIWCRYTSTYRIYYAPAPYSHRRNTANTRETRASANPSDTKRPNRPTFSEYLQVVVGLCIVFGYILMIVLFA